MKLSIIIISFNTSSLLQNCLTSVYKAIASAKLGSTAEIIVVDNCSSDDSVKMIRTDFPDVKLIENKSNAGFSEANNQGIRVSCGDFILLLNSDTVVAKNSFLKLLEAAGKDHKIGVAGPKLVNYDQTLQQSLGFFPDLHKLFYWMTFIDDLPVLSYILHPYHSKNLRFYNKFSFPDWVTGACMLLRKKAIRDAGLLDSKIFMYGEEVEWCFRIKQAGFKVIYTPHAVVKHLKGRSGEGSLSGILEEFKSLIYYYKKHKTKTELILLTIILKIGILLRFVIFGIILRNSKKRLIYAKAFEMVG